MTVPTTMTARLQIVSNSTWPSKSQSNTIAKAAIKADWPSEEAYRAAATVLRCEVAAIKAVAQVEAAREGGFLDTGEPLILFERHWFSRLTKSKYDGRRLVALPRNINTISYPTPGGYGTISQQHKKLQFAATLDRISALKSCSWGLFQIMGFNYARCGFQDVAHQKSGIQRFVNAMYRSVDDHLMAFTVYIRSDERLVDAIQNKDWAKFARVYNGSGYKKNNYDGKMATAFNLISRNPDGL